MREFTRVQPNPKKKGVTCSHAKGGRRREETAGKKSPQKEYKKRMKGEEEDEIFKSDWSQRGLKALGNNQTTKHTSVQDCLHKTYTHGNSISYLRKFTNTIHCFC